MEDNLREEYEEQKAERDDYQREIEMYPAEGNKY
jgi:hypothetical protein